jgi:hypothetical protein
VTEQAATNVSLVAGSPLPSQQMIVLRALKQLGQLVPTSRWCLIGGLMVEILLASRGAAMIRATGDGDIVGDVVADRRVLRKLASGLLEMNFEESPTGWDGDIGVRFRDKSSAAFIDVLTPANSSRLKNVVPTQPNRRSLEAPGTDFALLTATDFLVTYADAEPPLRIRVPSVVGGLYAKASACHEIRNAADPHKHLQDAAALLTVSRLPEFSGVSKAVRKRLNWLYAELADENSIGWEYVAVQPRNDAIARLRAALGVPLIL